MGNEKQEEIKAQSSTVTLKILLKIMTLFVSCTGKWESVIQAIDLSDIYQSGWAMYFSFLVKAGDVVLRITVYTQQIVYRKSK